jgi:hypothetical protein
MAGIMNPTVPAGIAVRTYLAELQGNTHKLDFHAALDLLVTHVTLVYDFTCGFSWPDWQRFLSAWHGMVEFNIPFMIRRGTAIPAKKMPKRGHDKSAVRVVGVDAVSASNAASTLNPSSACSSNAASPGRVKFAERERVQPTNQTPQPCPLLCGGDASQPARIKDMRLAQRSKQSHVICDECHTTYRTLWSGEFYIQFVQKMEEKASGRVARASLLPHPVSERETAWRDGRFDATWMCVRCYGSEYNLSLNEVRDIIGMNLRTSKKAQHKGNGKTKTSSKRQSRPP